MFYRLNVVPIRLPPLRERLEDIPLLAQAFVREFAAENGKKVSGFTPDAMELLLRYSWPGNVRELRTSVEHAVVLCRGEKISPRDLPQSVRNGAPGLDRNSGTPLRKTLRVKDAEKDLMIQALKESQGNRTLAARKLGISRRSLYRKMAEYGIEEL